MGGLQARSAFAEINAIGVATNAMLLLAPLAVAQTLGVELPGLVASVAATRVLVLLLLLWRCTRQYPAEAPLSINRGAARQLLRFGGWATVSAAVAPLLLVLDRFLIGSYLGARAVSHYVIPFQLAERTTMLASALGSALFPRLAACALEAERQQLALHALQVLALWTSPLVALAFLLSGPFLSWWISPELAQRSTAVAQVLFLAFWLSSLATVPYTKLLATGRPDLVAKCHLAQLLPYLAFLAVALQAWGLLGAALAFAARVVADFLLLSHWADLLARGLRLLAIPFALLASTLAAAWPEVLPDAWRWALGTALTLALSAWSLMHARQSMPFSGRSHL
jgi:O-antigen/teichoic acid export membrane protein